MTVTLNIQLLTGRYHATPWNKQVNEETCEWPPSPWRVLRTLVAMGHRHQVSRSELLNLMSKLAEISPHYQVPPAEKFHTRHYMPVVGDKGPSSALVWDTFYVTSKDAQVVMTWSDLTLTESEFNLLSILCGSVSYLGRAESWVSLTASDDLVNPDRLNLIPSQEKGDEKLLTPLTPSEFQGFLQAVIAMPQKGKKQKFSMPQNLLEVLELQVADYHNQGWNQVPGAKWVHYQEAEAPVYFSAPSSVPECNFARFLLVAPVLPLATQALSIGERFRGALLKTDEKTNQRHPVFTGKNDSGTVSEQQHQHAFYLPEINEQGRIESVLVYAKGGFDLKAIQALQELTKIWDQVNRSQKIQVVLTGLGMAQQYRFNVEQGEESLGRCRLLAEARVWQSMTPVVPARYPIFRRGKPRMDVETGWQKDCIEHQVWKELQQQGFPAPMRVEEVERETCGSRFEWWQYRRQRSCGQGSKGPDKGFWLEIEFDQGVPGPIALGYGAHFGLGVFTPKKV